jgi:hypothetical protein
MSFKIGLRPAQEFDIKLVDNKITAPEVQLDYNCTLNNDLVDYFKTLF